MPTKNAESAVEEVVTGLRRLVAPNPGMMTGPGTNTYLLGTSEIAVIDPGPCIDAHIERIIAEAGAPIRWILVTHTHPDHSPAAAPLAERTGALQLGMQAPAGPHQDLSFVPDSTPVHGERLSLGDTELEAIHTPGHASNHYCYLLRAHGCLMTGDHIINGSTVVIDPPDGSMADYLNALEQLKRYPLSMLAPGHGDVIRSPLAAIDALIAHRGRREQKVLQSLEGHPNTTLLELVRHVYDEVDEALHRVAARSLLAHLLKLREEGSIQSDGDRWSLAPRRQA